MGEIADMMLDGTLDYETGEYLGEGEGIPRTAGSRGFDWASIYPKGMHGGRKAKDTECTVCGRKVRGQDGLHDHMKDVHREEYKKQCAEQRADRGQI